MTNINYNIAKALPDWANKTPDKIAVAAPLKKKGNFFTYEEMSFKDLNSLSLYYAQEFKTSGLKAGDKVLMFVKPSVNFSALTFALFRCGLVPIFIDPGMGRKNLLQAIEHIRPHALVAEPIVHFMRILFPQAFKSVNQSFTMGNITFGTLTSIPTLRKKWEATQRACLEEIMHPCQKKTMAAVLFTSGGTGIPKAVHYNHGIFNAQVSRLQELFCLTPEDIDLPGFPLFSLFTITMGMKSAIPAMNPSKPGRADPVDLIRNINDHQATFVAGSPAIWQNLAEYCLKNGISLPSIKYLVMFGAPVSHELHKAFKSILTNGDTYTPYGATECLPVANISGSEVLNLFESFTQEQLNKGVSTCVGKPVENTEVRIAPLYEKALKSTADFEWLMPGETGEVCVYSETVTPEYIGMNEKTQLAKIKDPRGGLWHRMGDLGNIDSQGKLWFCGRMTHRLDIDGRVTPCIPQESIFNSLPIVKKCALVGPIVDGRVRPTLIIEANSKLSSRKRKEVEEIVLKIDHSGNRIIDKVIFTKKLPVDVRHNIKIDRLKLKQQVESGELS